MRLARIALLGVAASVPVSGCAGIGAAPQEAPAAPASVAPATEAPRTDALTETAPSSRIGAADGRVDRRSPVVRTVERVGPAVVNVSTEALVRNPFYGGPLAELLFGESRAPAQYMPNSLGSGVIVDAEGHVVTNEHVLAAASRVSVTLLDGRQVPAEFIGSAPQYDLAVLKLSEPGPYPFVSLDFDEPLHPGETVIAIGNPFGLQSSVTVGVLSGLHRRAESGGERYSDFLQSDAAINPGNSGGALLTINGDLIGINTQIDARGQNLGFAIPVARVRKVVHDLVRFGAVQAAWLGLDAESVDLTAGLAKRLGVQGGGLFVRSVMTGSPAARAGVLPGDVVTEIQGERVRDDEQWRTALSRLRVGDEVRLSAFRNGETARVTCIAEKFPLDRGKEIVWDALGLAVEAARGPRGPLLMISGVREASQAHRIGFRRGLLLLGVDGERVETEEQLYRAVVSRMANGSVLLAVSDGRQTHRVPLALR